MHTQTSETDGHMHRYIGIAVAMAAVVLLSGCIIPDEFDLKFDIPNSSEVSWAYDGKWRIITGFGPNGNDVPPKSFLYHTKEKDFNYYTKALSELPGSTSLTHIEKNIWKQSISWKAELKNDQGKPVSTTFPFNEPVGKRDGLVSIVPEGDNSVLLTTVLLNKDMEIKELNKKGYKSSGTLTINTTGTIEQFSGPKLSKGWFSNSYSTKWSVLEGEPIKVRITW